MIILHSKLCDEGTPRYEHVLNVGETFECLPEAVNLHDANAVTLRSASNVVIGFFLATCAIRAC